MYTLGWSRCSPDHYQVDGEVERPEHMGERVGDGYMKRTVFKILTK